MIGSTAAHARAATRDAARQHGRAAAPRLDGHAVGDAAARASARAARLHGRCAASAGARRHASRASGDADGATGSAVRAAPRTISRRECDTVVVAGLSMGALLATLLAADDPRIGGIALLSPTLRYDGRAFRGLGGCFRLAHVMPFAGQTFYWSESPPYGLKRQTAAVARHARDRGGGARREHGVRPVPHLRRLDPRAQPDGARGAPASGGRALPSARPSKPRGHDHERPQRHGDLRSLGSPDKSIHWLTGCDHVITLDLKKHEVARAVSAFAVRTARRKACSF